MVSCISGHAAKPTLEVNIEDLKGVSVCWVAEIYRRIILWVGSYKEEMVQYKCFEVCPRIPFEQRKAGVLSWTRMHDKSKRGLSKWDTTGCSHLGQQRWVVPTVWHKSDAGVQQGPFLFWMTIVYLPVLRLGADFHCSYRYQGPGLWWHFRALLHSRWTRIIPLLFPINKPHLSSWRKASFGNFDLLLSPLIISIYFVSSEPPEHPDSSWDVIHEKKMYLGILIFLGTFACKHLPVCAIRLLAAENLFFRNILMNSGTLAWMVCLSPEQGGGMGKGGDSGRCRETSSDLSIISG